MFVILLPILIKFENNSANSVIPMDMLKNREIRISSYTSFLYGIIETVIIYIPSLAILSLALNYEQASLVMLPFVITTTIAALFIGKALDKYGSRRLMTTGSFTMVIGLVLMGYFSYNLYLFIIGEVLASYGMLTLIGAPLRYLILSETAPGERGSGQAIVNMLSSVGQIIGGALIGAIIASYNGTIVGYHYTYILVVIFGVITYYLTRKLKSRQEQLKAMKKNS
jgi:MFS family permease